VVDGHAVITPLHQGLEYRASDRVLVSDARSSRAPLPHARLAARKTFHEESAYYDTRRLNLISIEIGSETALPTPGTTTVPGRGKR
jgi:hypothetical protein